MIQPLVSVILPAYNAGKTIGAAVRSILDQDYGKLELIIIDDGSTDETSTVVRAFSDSRINLIVHSFNVKLIDTLNEGLSAAKGKYIARMDADDVSNLSRLGKQVRYMESRPEIGICGTGIRLTGNGNSISRPETESNRIKARLLFDNCFNHPTIMYRREFVEQYAVTYDSAYTHAEDYALWCEISNKTEFGNLNEPLLDYNISEGQISKIFRTEQVASIRKAQQILLQRMHINVTSTEAEILECLFTKICPDNNSFFTEAEQLLIKINNANNRTGTLPRKEFSEHLGKTWFQICSYYATRKTTAGAVYAQSALKNLYSPPLKNRINLVLKSILR